MKRTLAGIAAAFAAMATVSCGDAGAPMVNLPTQTSQEVTIALTDDQAREEVLRACAGTYVKAGACTKCTADALKQLKAAGAIARTQQGGLSVQFAADCRDACLPTTCGLQGVACGEVADGCGVTLTCGAPCRRAFCVAAAPSTAEPALPSDPDVGATYVRILVSDADIPLCPADTTSSLDPLRARCATSAMQAALMALYCGSQAATAATPMLYAQLYEEAFSPSCPFAYVVTGFPYVATSCPTP